MNQTSFPIIGLAFLRKHAAVLNTAQGTIDFPKIQITMVLTDERQKCNPKPITIKTEAKHTIPAHSNDRKNLEDTIVEFNDIFARHRLDIGMNTQFKVSLTPQDDKPVYTQSLPVPINLKEDLTVELALMHRYGIITTLPFSKYASPIFAQRKPNGKLRLLVDMRKINALIADDYINNNQPVSTLSDAAQHLAGKKLFCKPDCSLAYHCLQMADQRSVELFAFNFVSRTFAYRRLAQGIQRNSS